MAYQSFEELEVWRRSSRVAVFICRLVAEAKPYALRDQMQRSSISVPSNIAEGCERDSRLEFIRFLRIAKGSAAELRTQVYIALKLEMISKADSDQLVADLKEISAMLQGLIRSLARRAASPEH
ncbi:MAG: four helix bundle protein [Verrucomicrobiales bacterium]|nr:four helix bundle protein [Verrucomicrobiales bacterium]